MSAALDLFAEKGVEATSVDEITQRAQVAKGTFYVHFPRKEDVLLEYAARMVADIDPHALPDEVGQACDVVAARLEAAMGEMPRPLAGRIIRELVGHREDWLRVLRDRLPVNRLLLPTMQRGQSQGVLRDDLSARRLAQALTILWLDTIIGWAERPTDLPLREDLARASRLFLDGARSR